MSFFTVSVLSFKDNESKDEGREMGQGDEETGRKGENGNSLWSVQEIGFNNSNKEAEY